MTSSRLANLKLKTREPDPRKRLRTRRIAESETAHPLAAASNDRFRLVFYAACLTRASDSLPGCRSIRKTSPCVISKSGTTRVGMK